MIVKLLLQAGADPNLSHPLYLASHAGEKQKKRTIVLFHKGRFLVEIWAGHAEVVKVLLNEGKGIDPNATQSADGATAAYIAAQEVRQKKKK